MNIEKWLNENTESLKGKTVDLTGSTGGIGRELCKYLLALGARLVVVDRSREKQAVLLEELKTEYPNAEIKCLICNLEDTVSAVLTARKLDLFGIDAFINNAGAYKIPRHKCDNCLDNSFVINFLSPYAMIRELLPGLDKRGGRVVVVGSIAHNYSKLDTADIDFSTRKKASLVYGNAKRFLMFSLYPLFEGKRASLAVTHPGITVTAMTSHYPRLIYALIKYPMHIIFMQPRKAALSILCGLFDKTAACEWIGPRLFNIWGKPSKKVLKTCCSDEVSEIQSIAEGIYLKISSSTT